MQKKFSWKERASSFSFAWDGLKALFTSEHNAWIHLGITAFVIVLSFITKVSFTEAALLFFTTGFVFVAEIFNTAIEKTMDLISREKHPQIKLIKDLAAAAVLVAAATALVIGCIIFIPKLL